MQELDAPTEPVFVKEKQQHPFIAKVGLVTRGGAAEERSLVLKLFYQDRLRSGHSHIAVVLSFSFAIKVTVE